MVRIRRSHRRGPGSIPGVGTFLFCLFLIFLNLLCVLVDDSPSFVGRRRSISLFNSIFCILKEKQEVSGFAELIRVGPYPKRNYVTKLREASKHVLTFLQ